ncbi:MAG TPA: ChaN family lipoprotein, partial [Rhodanobacteraceae bacterium]
MRRTAVLLASIGLCAFLGATPSGAEPDILHLTLGDAARKGHDVPLVLDGIVDTESGSTLAPDELVDRLAGVKLLIVGESHTAIEAHRVEARIIDALARKGRTVLVGVEMFPYTAQDWLDAWNGGLVTEAGFLHLSHWYRYWGFPWQYYRDVFVTARNNDAKLVALNAPIEVVRAVRQKGFKNLTEDEAAHIPQHIDVDSPEQMTLFRASFPMQDSVHGGGSDDGWKRMLSAQATWDATMAFNAVKALDGTDANTIMVVIAGSGHVEYGLGIERQAKQWFKGPIATLIPVPVRHTGGASQTVRASYADYVWGIPSEMYPAYPDLGISLGSGT